MRLRRGPELAWRPDLLPLTRLPLDAALAVGAGLLALFGRDEDMESTAHEISADARVVTCGGVAGGPLGCARPCSAVLGGRSG